MIIVGHLLVRDLNTGNGSLARTSGHYTVVRGGRNLTLETTSAARLPH